MVDLHRMRQLIRQTVNIQWKLEQEEAMATKITTVLTGMPRGGGQHDQVSDGAISIAELKEEYGAVLYELEQMRSELNEMIDTLGNVNHRAAMRMRYIKGHKLETIADAVGVKRRTIYRYLESAEEELYKHFPDKIIK